MPTLYHGTAERHLPTILKDGLKPRGKSGRTNWKHSIESNPDTVYLTDSYPLHFAFSASEGKENLVIIEVEPDIFNLVPDEDFMEQATRRSDQFPEIAGRTMKYRTRWWRRRVKDYAHHWGDSLKGLGTVGHVGPIAPDRLRRYALVAAGSPAFWMSDPTITLMNQKIMGDYYRALNAIVFGDEPDWSQYDEFTNEFRRHALDDFAKTREGVIGVYLILTPAEAA